MRLFRKRRVLNSPEYPVIFSNCRLRTFHAVLALNTLDRLEGRFRCVALCDLGVVCQLADWVKEAQLYVPQSTVDFLSLAVMFNNIGEEPTKSVARIWQELETLTRVVVVSEVEVKGGRVVSAFRHILTIMSVLVMMVKV